jgi:FkbM family methyltransferase
MPEWVFVTPMDCANPGGTRPDPESLPPGSWVRFEFDGVPIQLWANDPPDTVQAVISQTGSFYEVDQLQYLRALLPYHPRIVDVGANIGNHSIFFDKICHASKVWAIEPNHEAVVELKRNIAANGCQSIDITLLGIAVGASPGRASLSISSRDQEIRNRGGMTVRLNIGGPIAVARLDNLVRSRIDLLKIDVEGMAADVLEGATRLIERSFPLLFIEVMESEHTRIAAWLQTHGYQIARVFPMYEGIDNYFCRPKWPRLLMRLLPPPAIEWAVKMLTSRQNGGGGSRRTASCAP